MPPGIQLTQLDMPGMEDQEMALTDTSYERNEAASGRGRGRGKQRESRIEAAKEPKKNSLTENLNSAANSIIKDQRHR